MLGFASVAVIDFPMFLHITFIRPNLTLAGCPTMISLHLGVSTTKTDGLERIYLCTVEALM